MKTYPEIANPLIQLGYAVLPVRFDDRKAPAVPFAWIPESTTEAVKAEMGKWSGPDGGGLLMLDALPGSGMPHLDVLDVDDPAELDWVIATFGDTQLKASTGRVGGGWHLYYLRDPSRPWDEHGSLVKCFGGRGVDWKTHHGYVVAPRSVHRTGTEYQWWLNGANVESIALTEQVIRSLPVLDRDVCDRERGARNLYRDFSIDSSLFRLRQSGGLLPKRRADDSAVVTLGTWKGRTVAEVAAELVDGETGIACPHASDGRPHKKDQTGESARLRVIDGKAAHMVCFACSTTYTYGGVSQHFASNTHPTKCCDIQVGSNDLTKEGWLTLGGMGSLLLRSGVQQTDTLVLRLGQGRGKTEIAAGLVKRYAGRRVIAVSPTRSLSREQARRLGLQCYLDLPETGQITGSVAVCLPSLHRCPAYTIGDNGGIVGSGADLLILDEVEQQIRALLGSHLSDQQAQSAYRSLVTHVRKAQDVVLLDADAGEHTRMLLEAAGRTAVWVLGPAAKARDAVLWPGRVEWMADLMEAAGSGLRVAVAVHSVSEADTIASLLPAHTAGDTVCITSESVGNYDLSNLDTILQDKGHLVYTPVLGTGVSISIRDHYDRVYALLADSVGTASDALQFVSRVRYPVDTTLRIGKLSGGRKPAKWESDPVKVQAHWYNMETATLRKVKFVREFPDACAVTMSDTGIEVAFADCEDARHDVVNYVRALSHVHAGNVMDGEGRVTKFLAERLSDMGGNVAEVAKLSTPTAYAKLVSEMRSAVRDEVEDERVAEIVAADLPDEDTVAVVRKRGPKTRAESVAMRKRGIELFYGPGHGSNPDTVRWDNRGKGRARSRKVAHLAAYLAGGEARENLRTLDTNEIKDGVSAPRLHHRTLRAGAQAKLLRHLGIVTEVSARLTDPNCAPTDIRIDETKAAALGLWALGHRGVFEALGVTVRKDAAENPMQLVGSVLRSCGLRTATVQSRSGGTRSRHYVVAGWEAMDMADRYFDRIKSGEIVGLHVDDLTDVDDVIVTDPVTMDELDKWIREAA